MEHLPYPNRPATPLPKTPYVCTRVYDQLEFLDYPQRISWLQADKFASPIQFVTHDRWYGLDNNILEDIFQRWLFFGLLHEVLGPSYRQNTFVRTCGSDRYLDTSLLPRLLEQWVVQARKWHSEIKAEAAGRLSQCLNIANTAISALGHEHRAVFNQTIRLSICSLWESLAGAIQMTFDAEHFGSVVWAAIKLRSDNVFTKRMLKGGWCIYDVSTSLSRSMSLAEANFLSALSAPKKGIAHEECQSTFCIHTQIDKGRYRLKHQTVTCDCRNLGPDHDHVASALQGNSFPLLRITGDKSDEIGLDVIRSGDNTPYIALSHVWADGLGNPSAQELPRCQLLRLKKLVASFRGFQCWGTDAPEHRDLLFWCDTVCVPPYNPDADKQMKDVRDNAMGKMRDVYEQAAYVLVLDETLTCFAFKEIGPLEAVSRLLISPWMRRLWTYQEVYLAKHPVVCFSDSLVDLRVLWRDIRNLRNVNPSDYYVSTCLDAAFLRLRQRQQYRDSPAYKRLTTISMDLSGRRLSVASDEAVCLSVLLDLSISDVLKAPNEEHMAGFWDAFSKLPLSVPQGIIFNRFARISVPGLRWAPKSLLQPKSNGSSPMPALVTDPTVFTHATADGLFVNYPAWRVSAMRPPPGLEPSIAHHPAFKSCDEVIGEAGTVLRGSDGVWWSLFLEEGQTDWKGNGLEHPLWKRKNLILVREFDVPESCPLRTGLLGAIWGEERPQKKLSTLSIVRLRRERDDNQHLWSAAYEKATALLRSNRRPQMFDCKLNFHVQPLPQIGFYIGRFLGFLLRITGFIRTSYPEGRTSDVVFDFSDDYKDAMPIIEQHSSIPSKEYDFAMRVLLLYLGRYAAVEEVFDSSTEWYID